MAGELVVLETSDACYLYQYLDRALHMSAEAIRIVHKLWSYCLVLRGDRLSCSNYLEQVTYLLFTPMAEQKNPFAPSFTSSRR
jgi:hypothetical protein